MPKRASNTETIGGLTVDTDGAYCLKGDSGWPRIIP